jgi:SAM-dependent methyltransferase
MADMREVEWPERLAVGRFDAVVSSLALHWLEEQELTVVYRIVRALLRPGGMVLNADFLPTGRPTSRPGSVKRTKGALRSAGIGGAALQSFRRDWVAWWDAVERDPSMHAALREGRLRLPGTVPPRRTTGPNVPVSLEANERALRNVGFHEVSMIWQDDGMRTLLGVG